MDLIIRLVIYVVIIGGIVAYFLLQRRHSSRKYRRTFRANLDAVEKLLQKGSLTPEEDGALVSRFLEAYWIFEGVILPEYLDGLYPEITQSARSWEMRALQLRELQSEDHLSQHQLDLLREMKQFALNAETARWPGVSYNEQEFFEMSNKKIPLYAEIIREFMMLIDAS
jgi:hypothetical protein